MSAKYLPVAEIAERWSCDPSRVYREIAAGRLRALHIGDQTKRVSVSELARYENERTGARR